MADELQDVGDQLVGAFQNPALLVGIPLALLGAVFMSFGAQYQHRGVVKVEKLTGSAGTGGLNFQHLLKLLSRPSWVVGTLMLGLAIVCQLSALAVAPLIVVQPLGAIALVITTLLNAQISGHRPTKRSLIAIGACVGGIFVFVTIAALFATAPGIVQTTLSYVPLTAPLLMPERVILGDVAAWEPVLSALLVLVFAALSVGLGARLYEGSVLHTSSRLTLRQAWRRLGA